MPGAKKELKWDRGMRKVWCFRNENGETAMVRFPYGVFPRDRDFLACRERGGFVLLGGFAGVAGFRICAGGAGKPASLSRPCPCPPIHRMSGKAFSSYTRRSSSLRTREGSEISAMICFRTTSSRSDCRTDRLVRGAATGGGGTQSGAPPCLSGRGSVRHSRFPWRQASVVSGGPEDAPGSPPARPGRRRARVFCAARALARNRGTTFQP